VRLNRLVWLGLGMAAASPIIAAGFTVWTLLGGPGTWPVIPLLGLSLASFVPLRAGLRRFQRENSPPGPEQVASNGGTRGYRHGTIERAP
jgi:membrane protein implicated in regulation of membrane protease activity